MGLISRPERLFVLQELRILEALGTWYLRPRIYLLHLNLAWGEPRSKRGLARSLMVGLSRPRQLCTRPQNSRLREAWPCQVSCCWWP